MIHLDYETFSECSLKKFGAYRYAEDFSTEILLCAVALDDEDPVLWVHPDHEIPGLVECDPRAKELISRARGDEEIYAHNAPFEIAVSKYQWEWHFHCPPPHLEQWRCTYAMARRAAIPSSLEDVGEFLNLNTRKDKRGKALIKLFCEPRKPTKKDPRTRILPKDEPEQFREFADYCLQDVRVERAVHKKLKAFELKGETLEAFQFDLRMNDRGVPVNVDALEKTHLLVQEFNEKLTQEFRAITNLNPTQGVKFLLWLQERGYTAKNLQAETIEKVLANLPQSSGLSLEAYEALKLKSLVGFAALAKIPTMLGAANRDGRVRGSLLWSGAERTHRWAGRIIQPQNFKRPVIKDTETLYSFLCSGKADLESIEMLHENPLLSIASCIRHFIQLPNGVGKVCVEYVDQTHNKTTYIDNPTHMVDADYAAIEARVNPWLCGAEKKLELFRQGVPLYERMAAIIFNKPVEEVIRKAKTEIWRFVGKQSELGCGYNMGGEKFQGTCESYGQHIPLELAIKAVQAWRSDPVNLPIVLAWRTMQKAAMDAIRNPGKTFQGTPKISFGYTRKGGFPALVMKLPSGHPLIYPLAKLVPVYTLYINRKAHKFSTYYQAVEFARRKKIDPEEVREGEEIQFWGKVPGKTNKWGWVSTYGGKLLENATQATAGDIMTHGALEADRRGYGIFMLVHDQSLAEWSKQLGHSVEDYCDALCTLPEWAEGLPVEAEGGLIPFYKKD